MSIYSSRLPSTKQLQCFIAVATELNFRKAAEALSMSQPPLSRHIKSLEDLLRVRLFERDTHRVILTEDGKFFEKVAHRMLVDLDAASAKLRSDFGRPNGSVRLGLTSALDFGNIPVVARYLLDDAWRSSVRIEHAYSKMLVERLARGHIDLALIGDADCSNCDLVWIEIARDPMMFVLPDAHPGASRPTVDFSDLGDETFYWFSKEDNPPFFLRFERIFERFAFKPRRRPSPENDDVLLLAIARGEGVTLLPYSLCAKPFSGVRYVPAAPHIADGLHVSISLAKRIADENAAVQAIYEALSADCDVPD